MKKLFTLGIVASLALWPMAGQAAGFKDIIGHWSQPTVEWGVQSDLVKGYPDGTFKPNNQVTEAEFLTMFLRAYKDRQDLGDLDAQAWPIGYYDFAYMMHYPIHHPNEGRKMMMNRQQVADTIAASQGTTYKGRDAIHYLLLSGLAKGKGDRTTINSYDGQGYLTRSEAVAFVKNVIEKGNEMIQPPPLIPSPALPKIGDNQEIGKPMKELPKDVLTTAQNYDLHDKFMATLKIKDGKLTGTLLPLPENYKYAITYSGLNTQGKPFQVLIDEKYKIGDSFSIDIGTKGYLTISLRDLRIGAGYGGTRIEIPSMEAKRS